MVRLRPRVEHLSQDAAAAFPDATFEEVSGLGGTFQVVVGTDYTKPQPVRVAKQDSKLGSSTAADDICG